MSKVLALLGLAAAASADHHFYHSHNTWCGPGDGMIGSDQACQQAAADAGIHYQSKAGSEWHAGCIVHGGNAYYVALDLTGHGHHQGVNGGYLCRKEHHVSATPCACANTMVQSEHDCQKAARSLGIHYASAAGTEWQAGCIINNGNAYFVSSGAGSHDGVGNGGHLCKNDEPHAHELFKGCGAIGEYHGYDSCGCGEGFEFTHNSGWVTRTTHAVDMASGTAHSLGGLGDDGVEHAPEPVANVEACKELCAAQPDCTAFHVSGLKDQPLCWRYTDIGQDLAGGEAAHRECGGNAFACKKQVCPSPDFVFSHFGSFENPQMTASNTMEACAATCAAPACAAFNLYTHHHDGVIDKTCYHYAAVGATVDTYAAVACVRYVEPVTPAPATPVPATPVPATATPATPVPATPAPPVKVSKPCKGLTDANDDEFSKYYNSVDRGCQTKTKKSYAKGNAMCGKKQYRNKCAKTCCRVDNGLEGWQK